MDTEEIFNAESELTRRLESVKAKNHPNVNDFLECLLAIHKINTNLVSTLKECDERIKTLQGELKLKQQESSNLNREIVNVKQKIQKTEEKVCETESRTRRKN